MLQVGIKLNRFLHHNGGSALKINFTSVYCAVAECVYVAAFARHSLTFEINALAATYQHTSFVTFWSSTGEMSAALERMYNPGITYFVYTIIPPATHKHYSVCK